MCSIWNVLRRATKKQGLSRILEDNHVHIPVQKHRHVPVHVPVEKPVEVQISGRQGLSNQWTDELYFNKRKTYGTY